MLSYPITEPKKYTAMAEQERKNYEQRAEVITKKLMSKLYALESKALEAKMNTVQNIDKLEEELKNLEKHRKELETKYYDLVHSSDSQWRNISTDFEQMVNQINIDKQDFYEKTQGWLNDFNEKISDLEEKARNSTQDMKQNTQQQLDYLRNQRERLQNTLIDMRKESGDQWQHFRENIDEGLQGMTSGINKLYQKFQRRREDYSAQKFYESADSWINEFDGKIADLEEKAQDSTQEVKAAIDEQLGYIRDQRDKIQQYVEDMKKESGEKWKGFRSDVEERINNVRNGLSKAYQTFQGSSESKSQSESTGEETSEK